MPVESLGAAAKAVAGHVQSLSIVCVALLLGRRGPALKDDRPGVGYFQGRGARMEMGKGLEKAASKVSGSLSVERVSHGCRR